MNKNLKLKYGLNGVGKDDIWPKQNENTAPLKKTSPLENYVSAQEALLNKGDFAFSEKEWLKNVKDSIKNYDNFSYDVNSDALYQQLVNQYVQQGKMASADVMGKAAGMTGGYGNSYANTVGNQVYQSYIQQLNNEIPALYESALNQHNMKKQALYDEYALLMNEYDREYGLYADEYSRLLKSLEEAKETYNDSLADDEENKSDNQNNADSKNTAWKLVSDGGKNYFGGIDNNVEVTDPFDGKTKTLKKVYKERIQIYVDAGYDKAVAKEMSKEDVLEIQRILGVG